MYFIDGKVVPMLAPLRGRSGEQGFSLTPARLGQMADELTPGCHFPLGSTGIYAFGDGTYAFSIHGKEGNGFTSTVVKYRYAPENPDLFEEI